MNDKVVGRFTPGSWEVRTTSRQYSEALKFRELLGGGDREGRPMVLGEVFSGEGHDDPEDEVAAANASLMAAAPALYEAVRVAEQLANIASDWNLAEVEIDGEMHSISEVRGIFTSALALAQPKASQ